jgi:MOSC domain-containing protein YiiM
MTISDDSILAIFTSPGHNFFGHHGQAPEQHSMESRSEVSCVAGRGLEGDRFFDYRDSYKGQITFFQHEVYESLCDSLGVQDKPVTVFRRNIVTRGIDLT